MSLYDKYSKIRDIEKVLLKMMPNDLQFKDPEVGHTLTFCRTLVLSIRPYGTLKSIVCIRLYGTIDHSPFGTKISQVVYTTLADLRILPLIDINGISYAEASEWNNPIKEAMSEASDI